MLATGPGAIATMPAVAVRRRDGKTLVATATAGFGRTCADGLIEAIEKYGRPNGVSIQVTTGDLDVRRMEADKRRR